jgi:two-component sensor histidine kinase/ABC-type multidrug transport system ATPase subunit
MIVSSYVLQIEDLYYNEDPFKLEKINFNLKKGEVHSLVGDRGAGKNTLVQILTGRVRNIQGNIYLCNRNITNELSVNGLKEIAFLLKDSFLVDSLSIAGNFYLNNCKKSSLFINWKVLNVVAQNTLEELNLSLDAQTKIFSLSKMEKKLVDIARIYFQKPEIVILHEPIDNLNSKMMQMFYDVIALLKKNGTSFIYVTNEWEDALKISDRISVLFNGKLMGTLLAEDAKKNPRKLINMIYNWNPLEDEDAEFENKKYLASIFNATKYITSNFEFSEVLKLILNHITQAMNADSGIIYLFDDDKKMNINIVDFSTPKSEAAKLKKEFILQIIREKDVYYDNSNNKNFSSLFVLNNNVKAIICLPILVREKIIGLIQVSYEKIYVYSEKELIYLLTLSRQIAIAIEDYRLMGSSALLQESHHRIKNNLQTIVSLISLEKDFMGQKKSVDLLIDDIISRIKSIALVHELLSRDKIGSIINVKQIIDAILNIYTNDKNIDICSEIDDIFVLYSKATAISLIINELINNCFKHAFNKNNHGKIFITCKNQKENIMLTVKDDGLSLVKKTNSVWRKGLGLTIVESIIKNEFNGNININYSAEGAEVIILLPVEKVFLTK